MAPRAPVRAAIAHAGVLGSPITHSLSPALHTAGYRELGLTGWTYDAIECDEHALAGFLDSLGPDWAGLSLTMPLKRAVLPLLDETEQLATDVGAANTVLLREGRRLGYNTDVPGMVTALREAGISSGGNALILGGGATACSALAALRELGAADVAVAVRSRQRAGPLREVAARLGLDVRLVDLDEQVGLTGEAARDAVGLDAALGAAGHVGAGSASTSAGTGHGRWRLLISTIPAASAVPVARQIAGRAVHADAVFDVGYDPWPTALAEAARSAGLVVISGYELLVNKAVVQFEMMTGKPAPAAVMRAAGLAEVARRRNIH